MRPTTQWILAALLSGLPLSLPAVTTDFCASDSAVTLDALQHSVAWTQTGVTFVPRRGPSWSWTLGDVRSGDTALAIRGDAIPAADRHLGRVDYDRGPIVERYIARRSTVEQQFVIKKRLSREARDLQIEGFVASRGTFAAASSGWTWSDAHGVVSLGRVNVVDAKGVTLAATMQVSADSIRITVDGGALRRAAYPVTIDPEIGTNDFRITYVGPDGNTTYAAILPAVAFNSTNNEFFVVWQQYDGVENEIYGQRINGVTGALIGSSIRISDMGPDGSASYSANNPAVAYNSTNNEYLVVWRGDDNVNGLVDDETEIFGQRINAATGGELGTNDFRISNMGTDGLSAVNGGGECDYPAVAYNATNNEYLVAWHGTNARSERVTEIFGQRITASTGANVGTHDFLIKDYTVGVGEYRNALRPKVAWNSTNGEYLVVWAGEDLVDNEVDIFGQRITAASGALTGTTDFQISDMGPAGNTSYRGDLPDVAYNNVANEYLVVWSGTDETLGAGEYEIFGQRLNAATGAEVGTNDFRLSDMGPAGDAAYQPTRPGVRFSGGEYLVVWSSADTTIGATEVYGQRVNSLGAEIGDNDFRLSDMGAVDTNASYAAADCAIAAGADGMSIVVWRGADDTPPLVANEYEIFGQLFAGPSTGYTTITATPTTIATGGSSTSSITVQVKHAGNGNMTQGGSTITLSTTAGTLSGITDNNNGTYGATLTSSATPGTATITGTLNGLPIADNAVVTFQFGPPANLVATATSTTTVSLTWNAVGGATGYEVYRAAVIPGYALIASPAATSYPDSGLTPGQAYVYIVRATSAAATSSFSTPDAATLIVFTDPTLSSSITVKAAHLNELRQAVNAMRVAANLAPTNFGSAAVARSTLIQAAHVNALRTALDAARSTIGLPAIVYTDSTLTVGSTPVRATHFAELRAGTQ